MTCPGNNAQAPTGNAVTDFFPVRHGFHPSDRSAKGPDSGHCQLNTLQSERNLAPVSHKDAVASPLRPKLSQRDAQATSWIAPSPQFHETHAVKMFNLRFEELDVDINFDKIKVIAVGNKTSAVCKKYGIPVHIIPEKFSAEGVVEKLSRFNLKDKVVFIPRSAIGKEELPRGLQDLGAIIKSVPVYNVSLPTKENIKKNIGLLKSGKPDLYIFTSPSTFENFLLILDIKNAAEYFKSYDVAAIGPTTKAAIEKKNVTVNIMPDEYTIDGLIHKIISYYNS